MPGGKERKHYYKPILNNLGDLRDLTLGGSEGINDSGSDKTHKPLLSGLIFPEINGSNGNINPLGYPPPPTADPWNTNPN